MEYEVFHPPLLWSFPWHFLPARIDVRLVGCKMSSSLAEKNIQVSKACSQFHKGKEL